MKGTTAAFHKQFSSENYLLKKYTKKHHGKPKCNKKNIKRRQGVSCARLPPTSYKVFPIFLPNNKEKRNCIFVLIELRCQQVRKLRFANYSRIIDAETTTEEFNSRLSGSMLFSVLLTTVFMPSWARLIGIILKPTLYL